MIRKEEYNWVFEKNMAGPQILQSEIKHAIKKIETR